MSKVINKKLHPYYKTGINGWIGEEVVCRGNKPYAPKIHKIGRNELCPCGSGKKYKKCCLMKGE